VLGTGYRIKLPTAVDLPGAYAFYGGKPEVQGVLPATNFAEQALMPNDGTQANHTIANLPDGWQTVQNAIGSVGSRRIRVAVIDQGVDMTHPDIAMNIAINQAEIPAAVMAMLTDV